MPPAVQPPEGFRSLELGQSFIETNWGPDITAEQIPTLRTLTSDAALREQNARTAVLQEQVKLTQALLGKPTVAVLQERTDSFVETERKLVAEQISTIVALYATFSAEQMTTRLKMGYPPILAELISAHPMTGAANPFARADTKDFTDAQIEDVLRRKLDVHAQFLEYQKAMAEAVAGVGKLDLSKPDWGVQYQEVTNKALDAWVTYRKYAVGSFVNFLGDLPADKRNRFLLGDGLTEVLKPAETRGSSTGNMIPSNPNESGVDLAGSGTPGAAGSGMDGGGMGGPGGGMGGPGGSGGGMGGPGMGGGQDGGGMGGPGMGGPGGMGGSGGGMGGPGGSGGGMGGGGMGGPPGGGGGMGGPGGGGGMGGPPPGQ
jgi:hypothetical protein